MDLLQGYWLLLLQADKAKVTEYEFMYEDWFQKIPKKMEIVKCPVCSVKLGTREPNRPFMEHCEECKATYTWNVDNPKPSVKMDVKPIKGCECQNCRDRD